MRDLGIWILSVVLVYALGFILADDFGRFIGFYYMIGSGIFYAVRRFVFNKKTIKSKTIALGQGNAFIVPSSPEDFKSK